MIHGRVSYMLNQEDGTRGRKVFQNYWDRCIRNEKDFYTRFNYIHYNPVKHSLVDKMEDYEFSSYRYYLQQCGQEWLNRCFELYPVIDFNLDKKRKI